MLVALVPRLIDLLKSGIGLATKASTVSRQTWTVVIKHCDDAYLLQVSTAQTVTSLVHHSMHGLTPHAGQCHPVPRMAACKLEWCFVTSCTFASISRTYTHSIYVVVVAVFVGLSLNMLSAPQERS